MRARIYNYETVFDFGKHKGQSLRQVLAVDSRYIGYVFIANVRRVILHPEIIRHLDENRFFDDLEFPYYGPGGSMPFNVTNISKEEIIAEFNRRYEAFNRDPEAYERTV